MEITINNLSSKNNLDNEKEKPMINTYSNSTKSYFYKQSYIKHKKNITLSTRLFILFTFSIPTVAAYGIFYENKLRRTPFLVHCFVLYHFYKMCKYLGIRFQMFREEFHKKRTQQLEK